MYLACQVSNACRQEDNLSCLCHDVSKLEGDQHRCHSMDRPECGLQLLLSCPIAYLDVDKVGDIVSD